MKNVSFEMHVSDVFDFTDGRTAFVGSVDSESPFLGPGPCELWIDGEVASTFEIEGEMLPDQWTSTGERAVSTREAVDVERSRIRSSHAVLKSRERPVLSASGTARESTSFGQTG